VTHQCEATSCGKPTTTTLCHDHQGQLLKLADDFPSWIDDLVTTLTRQGRTTTGTTTPSDEAPIPFNPRAGTAFRHITTTLIRWQERIADHTGQPVRITEPMHAATWIAHTLHRFHARNLPDAGQLLTALNDHTKTISKIVDRPERKWYAGRCGKLTTTFHDNDTFTIGECPRELYADTETGTITCPLCGGTHDIATRQATLLTQAKEKLATATEAARAIVVWSDYQRGENRLVKRIGTWADRGRITQHGTIPQGGKDRPLYRIGDILDLLAEDDHDTKAKTATA
jgi:hypothetical protein